MGVLALLSKVVPWRALRNGIRRVDHARCPLLFENRAGTPQQQLLLNRRVVLDGFGILLRQVRKTLPAPVFLGRDRREFFTIAITLRDALRDAVSPIASHHCDSDQ